MRLAREGELRARDRDAGHAAAARARRVPREAAPAAADLEQVVAGGDAERGRACARTWPPGPLEARRHAASVNRRARVGHRAVQPQRVEVVAEVVVRVDVLARARARVGAQPVGDAVEERDDGIAVLHAPREPTWFASHSARSAVMSPVAMSPSRQHSATPMSAARTMRPTAFQSRISRSATGPGLRGRRTRGACLRASSP